MPRRSAILPFLPWLAGAAALGAFCAVGSAQTAAAPQKPTPVLSPQQAAAFFETKIRPVLAEQCYSCHGDGLQQASLRVDSRNALLKGGATGAGMVPGDAEKSLLVHVLRYDGTVKMPPSGKLPAAQIADLTRWVAMGAPWPASTPPPSASEGGLRGKVKAQKATHWAFRPVKKPALPAVKNAAWAAKSPIDRFILAKLQAKGLSPAPPADKRTLIRRAYFDLIGLPPTPAQVSAFLSDKSPNAFAKVVDELLASPHYGERWARHWLDVARYADSNGLDENKAFAHAWRYRDYVVNALNRDKPYDQFIQEQIAGDLMPTDDETLRNERITGTGFLTLGAKVLAEQDKPKLVMDIVDEQIEVTSKAVLGLTVSCARCHDHKFDPVSTKDYYALAGIFKSTKTMRDLGFVSNWNERPLLTKALEAETKAHAETVKPLESEVKTVTDGANAALAAALRRDAGKYLLAAWQFSRQPGALLPVGDAPAKPGDPERIVVEAEKFSRGNANRDTSTYGQGIGIIHTTALPTFAEWDVTVATAGSYQIDLRYAALEARPVTLSVNGQIVRSDAAGQVTGSWNPDTQRWDAQAVAPFTAGKNVVRIERAAAIPHFDKLLIARVVKATAPNAARPPQTLEQIAKTLDLIPGVVKRFAERLRASEDSPPLSEARRTLEALPPNADAAPVTAKFGPLLVAAADAKPDDKKSLFALPGKAETLYSAEDAARLKKAKEALAAAQARAPKVPIVMAVEEGKPEDVRVHVRGSTQSLGDTVPRRFVAVLTDEPPAIGETSSGRLELARWLTRPQHPLTARVAVNRVWKHHFGEGLVRTPDNWGVRGEKPTHPELLDYLAATFVAEDRWSLKRLHRRILLSATYRMSSAGTPATVKKAALVDPENQLLWRANRRRLEVEPFRDAMLAVSGLLDRTFGGSLLDTPNNDYVTNDQSGNGARYNAPRRSLYLPVIRNALFDMFQAFDFGDPSTVNAHRAATTVAPQALYVLNSPFVGDQARAWSRRLLALGNLGGGGDPADDPRRLQRAYAEAFARPATPTEIAQARSFLKRYEAALAAKGTEADPRKRREKAWESYCRILFASNEFIYLN